MRTSLLEENVLAEGNLGGAISSASAFGSAMIMESQESLSFVGPRPHVPEPAYKLEPYTGSWHFPRCVCFLVWITLSTNAAFIF